MLETVFFTVLRMTMEASLVILAVLLLRLALKKAPRGYACGLWLLVLLRLLCPVFPELPVSPIPEVSGSVELVESYTSQTPVFDGPEQPLPADPSGAVLEGDIPVRKTLSLQTLLAVLWAAGAASVLAWGCISLLLLQRKLQAAVPKETGVYQVDYIGTPFVMGVFRPRIYLPSDLPEAWEGAIVRHERCHIRHGDPLVKHLFFLALAVHWFNPLVWAAYRLAGRDMELRCDEAVMKGMDGSSRREYAQSLLCLSTGRSRITAPLAFSEGDIKQRIQNVLNGRRPVFWLSIAGAVLCVLAAVLLLTNPVVSPEFAGVEVLEYPGIPWLSSPEEVKAILDIQPEDIVEEAYHTEPMEDVANDYAYYAFRISNRDAFGQRAKNLIFIFYDPTWTMENLQLVRIKIYYPDGYEGEAADMEALKATLTDMYGPTKTESVRYSWFPGDKEVREIREDYPVTWIGRWESERTWLDLWSDQQEAAYYRYVAEGTAERQEDASATFQFPSQEEYLKVVDISLVSITLSDYQITIREMSEAMRAAGGTEYALEMSATSWLDAFRHADLYAQ